MITTAPAASGGLQQVAAALQMLVDRGVEIMSVFTGSSAVYNYTGQIREAFPTVHFG